MNALPEKILLATDGSEEAASARGAAVELTEKLGSKLEVVYVGDSVPRIGDMGPVYLDPSVEETVQQRLDEESRKLLDEQVKEVEARGGTVAGSHLGTGNQADSIVRLAEELDAGLVIMGSRGHGGIKRALMGSVADGVTRHAHCPVLVVRGDGREPLFPARILLAIDGSDESREATKTAEGLASGTGSELYVVHAGPTAQLPYTSPYLAENVESYFEQSKKEAREFLESRVEEIRGEVDVTVHANLRPGDPAKEIVELSDEIDAGLVVIGSRGLGGMQRALMGGVSDTVVRHAHCPVLVVRHEESREDAG
jgi:nucleotide-binding universal stress UspA family protein